MSNDLDKVSQVYSVYFLFLKTEASCEIIENESSVFSEGEGKYISSSEIEEENTSGNAACQFCHKIKPFSNMQ